MVEKRKKDYYAQDAPYNPTKMAKWDALVHEIMNLEDNKNSFDQ